jgi:hypothetical protein
LPNSAFANLTDGDGYWAAKIVSAFTDSHLAAAVEQGRYRDPRAAEYMVRTLAARRDIVARTWFDRIPPLDYFQIEAGLIHFHDLGEERGLYPGATPSYRYRSALVDAERDNSGWTDWVETPRCEIPLESTPGLVAGRPEPRSLPFLAVTCEVNRGTGWSAPVTVYFSRSRGTAVAVDR